jgi:L-lactate dehydrogenase complex protein LldE
MKVQLFVPCFVDQLYPQTAFNMVKVLRKLGCEVEYNGNQTCCGQPAFNAGFCNESKAVAEKFLKDFAGTEYIVAPSASCTGFVRNYYHTLFENDAAGLALAKQVGERCYEFTEFLVNILKVEDVGATFNATATYHDSCAALRECKIKEAPRKLLSNVKGLTIVEMNDVETCCGFGGTFAVKFGDISAAMADQKTNNIAATGASCVISTDCSCMMQISGVLKNKKMGIETLHIADVLAAGLD